MALRKFIAPNLLTRSIILSATCSRFLNTRSIANVFRTASYFLIDFLPSTPVKLMSRALKTLESGILRPDGFQGRWMVWQNTEALLLHRYTSKHRMEEVKVSVETNSYIIFGPGRNHVSKKLGTAGHGTVNKPAVLFITCKLPLGYSDEGEIDFDTYTMWIDLQRDLYNTSAIKIEESNQVLKITVPKLKPEWIHKAGIKWDYRSRLAS